MRSRHRHSRVGSGDTSVPVSPGHEAEPRRSRGLWAEVADLIHGMWDLADNPPSCTQPRGQRPWGTGSRGTERLLGTPGGGRSEPGSPGTCVALASRRPLTSSQCCLGWGLPPGAKCHNVPVLGFRNGPGSLLTLGAIDTSHYTGSLHWVPITVQEYWQFTVDRWVSGGPARGSSRWGREGPGSAQRL